MISAVPGQCNAGSSADCRPGDHRGVVGSIRTRNSARWWLTPVRHGVGGLRGVRESRAGRLFATALHSDPDIVGTARAPFVELKLKHQRLRIRHGRHRFISRTFRCGWRATSSVPDHGCRSPKRIPRRNTRSPSRERGWRVNTLPSRVRRRVVRPTTDLVVWR
jgi:hypothetical protein